MPTQLTREYRFFLRPGGQYARGGNSWGGADSSLVAAQFLKIQATIEGPVDPATGYLVNIQEIDSAIARWVADRIATSDRVRGNFFRMILEAQHFAQYLSLRTPSREAKTSANLPGKATSNTDEQDVLRVASAQLIITPHLSLQMKMEEPMSVSLTQEFEFSAAHRLHCDSMSTEQNRAYFGKCNNLNGHGHNYVVAVTVPCPDEEFPLTKFESLVKSLVIDRLDHKHLNRDVPEFASLNPSVENIARVIWNLLRANEFFFSLENIRVYETPKTWADYRE